MNQQGKARLRAEAEERLDKYGHCYETHAVFRLLEARGDGDDIVVEGGVIPCLRQQEAGSGYCCLADFVNPVSDSIGVFATSVDMGMETEFEKDPYERMMMQLLADRLAEATAELIHEEVRKSIWGYAASEELSIDDMLQGRFQGIRPAVGYPSLPDTSLNFVLDSLLDMKQIGIRLTESGAMKPHASVSGLMLAHPEARYFSIGKIDEEQLADYAVRRELPITLMRRFLGGNL